MWKLTDVKMTRKKRAPRKMRADERERMQDTMQLVQSARESLSDVDPTLVPEREAIEECFDMADRSLREALRSS
jgi:hypothetical protein